MTDLAFQCMSTSANPVEQKTKRNNKRHFKMKCGKSLLFFLLFTCTVAQKILFSYSLSVFRPWLPSNRIM